jgi:hypothetical protein
MAATLESAALGGIKGVKGAVLPGSTSHTIYFIYLHKCEWMFDLLQQQFAGKDLHSVHEHPVSGIPEGGESEEGNRSWHRARRYYVSAYSYTDAILPFQRTHW